MHVAIRKPEPLDVEGFLAFVDARSPDEKWEVHDGTPQLMVGGSPAHGLIAANLVHAVFDPARARGCRAIVSLLVAVGEYSAFEPDVLIRCGPQGGQERRIANPLVVFEVLSPSTMEYDRGVKFQRYRDIPDLQQIVFVYQDAYRVETWLRMQAGWSTTPTIITAPGGTLPIPAIETTLSMSDIYLDVVPVPLG